ncbi:acyltransferase family protein [Chitinophaga niabensis]|uniref:Peptidoglycan/LPS O-acetylase OafA/YrhL, contains acyltransferase and SGNH-hydrolase domains n=1 Tax=Chitinophaga niabensis TaxID=536979 RepID=A0A1N6H1J2_9BACT|nr:acyltransferase [Chitinophaga niabensis]SIO13688.1 Peptidoglycan/LPS O-acetylase OafA/YrhL, contains acyltransferase and SGNH-hydrolase domains [Chitinophaga niabensis]
MAHTNGKLAGLDHLRALAIITVLFYHYRMFKHPEWIDDVMGFGWTGVDLFFVLSGYLISSQLFASIAVAKPISLPEFFIKRFFRIIPAYLVVLAIYFLVPAFHEKEALPPLWKFLTFTQNFDFDIKHFGTFSHVWSLCVEEHFYLLFPLALITIVYFNATKRGGAFLSGLLLFGFAARLFTWYTLVAPDAGNDTFGITWYKQIYYPTYNRLDGLLAGVSIAALFTFKPSAKEWITKYGNVTLVLGFIVLTGAWFLCEDQKSFYASIFGFPLVAAGYGLLVVAALSPNCVLYKYNSRFTAWIAKLSFGLYLIHKGVMHVIQPLLAKMNIEPKGNLMFLLCLAGTILAALVLYKTVEEPFLRLRQRILASKFPAIHKGQLSKTLQ